MMNFQGISKKNKLVVGHKNKVGPFLGATAVLLLEPRHGVHLTKWYAGLKHTVHRVGI